MNLWAPIAVLLFVVGLGLALVSGLDRRGSAPAGTDGQTLEGFGRANASCRQWSDGCSVCQRDKAGSFSCSLPGIACQPSSLTCRQMGHGPRPAGVRNRPSE